MLCPLLTMSQGERAEDSAKCAYGQTSLHQLEPLESEFPEDRRREATEDVPEVVHLKDRVIRTDTVSDKH